MKDCLLQAAVSGIIDYWRSAWHIIFLDFSCALKAGVDFSRFDVWITRA